MGSVTASALPPMEAPPAAISTSQPPRKRRRRAPAAGAADDCFTCSNLGIDCDRRRPYCSQCLSDGKDCSGYKTTLTWGVGVASRGKLRGLSLPIAGTAKVNPSPTSQSPRRKPSGSGDTLKQKPKRSGPTSPVGPKGKKTSPPLRSPHSSVDGNVSELQSASSVAHRGWPWPSPTTPVSSLQSANATSAPGAYARPQHNLQPINTPGVNVYDPRNRSASSSSIGFSDYSFPSPIIYSASSTDDNSYTSVAFVEGTAAQKYSSQQSPMALSNIAPNAGEQSHSMWTQQLGAAPSGTSMNGSVYLDPPHQDSVGGSNMQAGFEGRLEREDDNEVEDTIYGNSISFEQSPDAFQQYEPTFLDDAIPDNSMVLSPYFSIAIGKTPRMQYLINYYTEVISPVIVAFDGPNNPYRTHILRLAMESETLQHAIAALSASNLRQRRQNNVLVSTCKTAPARRSSMAHSALTDRSWQSGVAIISPEDQAREELLHKSISIQSLNAALADPLRRKDDSILATLLILCLFHICDSGVAKFQTQFAGVKKLLSLRSADSAASNRNATSSLSKETSWYTRMFTWFDAFTATVNDREGQLQGSHLDISSLSDEEWALENLAGCDGRLFKIIAKLGRLNVLGQNGAVDAVNSPTQPQVLYPQPDPAHFDGKSWTNVQPSLYSPSSTYPPGFDDFAPPSPFSDPTSTSTPTSGVDAKSNNDTKDARSPRFWNEWSQTRSALLSWHLSANSPIFSQSSPSSTLPFSLTLDQKADLLNISESFRYSALLYLERLASPRVPSSDPKIQSWVSQALDFIRRVKSDVYLLWPLFITGSECVKAEDRQIIRQRCLDIQKDSGFMNNWSTLELLEKVWARSQYSTSGEEPVKVSIGTKRKASGSPDHDEWENHSQSSSKTEKKHGIDGFTNHSVLEEGKGGFRWRKVMDLGKSEGEYIVV